MVNTLRARHGRALALGMVTAFIGAQAPAQDAKDATEVDEVIVTGTYIRSSSFQQSSPVETLGREEFETKTQSSVASFLADLPYNTGGNFGQGGGAGGSTVNLRGLGSAATLVLVNGRRQARVPNAASVIDVNTLVPQIAIRNIEILKDGASALYGSDAVAGVANFITRRNFNGFEFRAQSQMVTHSGDLGVKHPLDNRFAALWGTELDKTHMTFAFEYSERNLIPYADLPDIYERGDLLSRTSLPGQVRIPRRGPTGALLTGTLAATTTLIRDPSCGQIPSTYSTGTAAAPTCTYGFWSDQALFSDDSRYHAFFEAQHDFSEHDQFFLEAGYATTNSWRIQTASGSISAFANGLTVPGENPGVMANPLYRARDANGALLFATPNPARPTTPLRDAAGRVVVSGTNPSGGIAFWEDVIYAGRPLTSQGGMPTGGTLQAGDFSIDRHVKDQNSVMRIATGFSGDLRFGNWRYDTSFVYSTNDRDDGTYDVLPRELQLAVQGYAGGSCNAALGLPGVGNCSYFNPFLASAFAAPGSAAANTTASIGFWSKQVSNNYRTRLGVYDAVLNGDLLALPAGPLSAAVGFQYRKENWDVDNAANQEIGNSANGTSNLDVAAALTVRSAFVEIAVPVIDSESFGSLDLNAAARYEDSGQFDTTDPKVGAIYQTPGKLLQIRGSWGSSFLAPSLFQQFTQSTRLPNVNSRGVLQPRVAAVLSGNPLLDPQEADAYNFGVSVTPLQNLKLSLDRWHYKFDRLITTEDAQAIVNDDEGPNGPNGKVLRDINGNILQIQLRYFNAAQLTTAGYDFTANFAQGLGRFGELAFNLNTTYTDTYDYQATATSAVYNGVNNTNARNGSINPSTKWRSQLQTQWSLGNHAASVTVHFTGATKNDLVAANDPVDVRFASFVPIDLSYSYEFAPDRFGVQKAKASVGIINALNEIPYFANNVAPAAFAFGTYDYRGRMVWARVALNF